jgi:hypothetical protein
VSNLLQKVNAFPLHASEFNAGLSQGLAFSVAEYFFKTGEQISYDFYLKLVGQLQTMQDSYAKK